MIPPHQIDEIFRAVRIEEVVGEFVHLKKRGVNYLGLCPFHNEKTPSFTVSPLKGIFKCFGCGKAGNSVGFLMEHLKLSYPEALRWLAQKYNIPIEERQLTEKELLQRTEKESIFAVLSFAEKFYKNYLWNEDEGKSVGLSYLRSRGLEDHIITSFGLGYAPASRNAFTQPALHHGFKKTFLFKSGQCLLKNDVNPETVQEEQIQEQDLSDRFTGRVMYPVYDEAGRVLGFGGRTLSNDKNIAKYVNSPESVVYHKSDVLYGLYQAKKHIQQENAAILVEGYMDVISLHQYGFCNTVASSGTSLTEGQIKKIHRFAENVILAYDGDEAGQKASERAVPMLLEEGLNVFLIFFPDGEDPDSYAKKYGKEALEKLFRKEKMEFIDYYTHRFFLQPNTGPLEKSVFASRMASWIALIENDIRRQLYVRYLSEKLQLPVESLVNEISRVRRERFKEILRKKDGAAPEIKTPLVPDNSGQEPEKQKHVPCYADEIEILRLLILFGGMKMYIPWEKEPGATENVPMTMAEYVINAMNFDILFFQHELHRKIFSVYMEHLSEKGFPDIHFFLNFPDEDVRNFISQHVIRENEISENWKKFGVALPDTYRLSEKAIQKAIQSLKERILTQIILELKKELKNPPEKEEDHLLLLYKIQQLEKEKLEVNKILNRSSIKFIPS